MSEGRILKLSDCRPGGLEQLRRVVNGMATEIPEDKRVEMLAALNAELDEQYTRIEQEVPGWHR